MKRWNRNAKTAVSTVSNTQKHCFISILFQFCFNCATTAVIRSIWPGCRVCWIELTLRWRWICGGGGGSGVWVARHLIRREDLLHPRRWRPTHDAARTSAGKSGADLRRRRVRIPRTSIQVAQKSKPLRNYQNIVLSRIKACQWD